MRFAVFALPLFLIAGACSSADRGSASPSTQGDELVVPTFSGIYSEDIPFRDEGKIWQLSLRPEGSFSMAVQGLYDCDHLECPSSSVLGRLGWTHVVGTWQTISGSSQVTLRPEGAAAFPLTLVLGANTLEAKGTLAGKDIAGTLPIMALYGKDHPRETQLDGTWVVDSPADADGYQSDLNGAPIDVKKTSHYVAFDAKARMFREWTGSAEPLASGPFSLGAQPDGKGVLVIESEQLPNAATVDSLDGSKVTLVVAGGAALHLTRK